MPIPPAAHYIRCPLQPHLLYVFVFVLSVHLSYYYHCRNYSLLERPHPGGTQRHSGHWTFVDLLFIVTIAGQTCCNIDPTYQEPILLYNTISAARIGQWRTKSHREGAPIAVPGAVCDKQHPCDCVFITTAGYSIKMTRGTAAGVIRGLVQFYSIFGR